MNFDRINFAIIHSKSPMAKIHALGTNPEFRQLVGPDVMEQVISKVAAVRRPLDVPATIDKLGLVLSHSGCVLVTEAGAYVLIEYMWGGITYISLCSTYKPGERTFVYRKMEFVHDDMRLFTPTSRVTVQEFAMAMATLMRGKPFAVCTHNCHHARYWTMKKFGMITKNPESEPRNQFFQGWVDYFHAP
jgi:hypothetical protein